MYKKSIIFLAMAALLLAACAAPKSTADQFFSGYSTSSNTQEGRAYEMPAAAPVEPVNNYDKSDYNAQSPEVKRIVIKNADLVMVVDDPGRSLKTLSDMAESMGGFVISAQMYQRTLPSGVEVPEVSLTIRVPADRLDEAMQRIEAEGSRPAVSKNINSQDVTSTYVDLQSRLRNLEAAEIQLQEIMTDARRTEEVLNVYNELIRVREQIEVIKGQIQYYDQASALSSISIQLMANDAVQPITIAGWEPAGIARNAVQSLVDALQIVGNAGIWTVLFLLPLLIILLLPVVVLVLIVRAVRRKNQQKSIPNAPAA